LLLARAGWRRTIQVATISSEMRRWVLAMMSAFVVTMQLSLPIVLAVGIDPCAETGDEHGCPPLGDDCHDCARCSPQPAVMPALPAIVLDVVPMSDVPPMPSIATRPPRVDTEPPVRVPRIAA
jgi:hypothetical protein